MTTSTTEASYDAVIIGSGHNGLVSALYLARAGWKVLVLERNADIGGAIRSEALTGPGYIHDQYSTNMNLFLASPVYEEFKDDLERHGLRFAVSDKPYCNLFEDGSSLRVYSDFDKTMESLRAHNPQDAEGFAELYEEFKRFRQTLLPLYNTTLPSFEAAKLLLKAYQQVGYTELRRLVRLLLNSTRELGEAYFSSKEMRALMATWGLHLDFGPDVSGGSLFPLLEAYSDMEEGIAITEGGASNLVQALAGLIREYGGEVRTESEVTRIITEGGRAVAVETASGERIHARKAIIANLTPKVLFGRLLQNGAVAPEERKKAERFLYGPATMMVHLALDRPVQWKAGSEISEFAYVHIAPDVDALAQTYTDALNGYLPASPLLIVGQTTAVDPSRTPGDQHILWIQVRALPREIKGDRAGLINEREWGQVREFYADRVIDKLEAYAPGIRDTIIGRVVYSPEDLARQNPNLVGGDSIGGSHHLRQNFLFRPFPGYSRYKMPVDNLYMVGAGTWPGGGNNATSGYLGAQRVLADQKPSAAATGLLAAGGALAGFWLMQRLINQRAQIGVR